MSIDRFAGGWPGPDLHAWTLSGRHSCGWIELAGDLEFGYAGGEGVGLYVAVCVGALTSASYELERHDSASCNRRRVGRAVTASPSDSGGGASQAGSSPTSTPSSALGGSCGHTGGDTEGYATLGSVRAACQTATATATPQATTSSSGRRQRSGR